MGKQIPYFELFHWMVVKKHILPETNIAPTNGWLEYWCELLVSGRVPSIVFAPLFHGPVLGCPSKLGSMGSKWVFPAYKWGILEL